MTTRNTGLWAWLKAKFRNGVTRAAWCLDARTWANSRLFARLTPRPQRRKLIRWWGASSLEDPSFTRCMYVQHRIKSSAVRLDGGESAGEALARWESKLNGYRLADELGIPRVPVLETFRFPEECPDNWLPTNAVVKLDHGSSGREVWILEEVRGRTDMAFDRRRGQTFSSDDLSREIGLAGGGVVLVEPLLKTAGGAPVEVKIYAFRGAIGLLLLLARGNDGRRRRRYVNPEGIGLGPIVRPDEHDDRISVPASLDPVLAYASAVSLRVPLPYVRVDFYFTPEYEEAWLFGEVTTAPGVGFFPQALDARLGQLWEEAAQQLILRTAREVRP